jgi:LmeA-like phospholipid-binding
VFRRLLLGVAVALTAGAVAVDRIAASVAAGQVADRLQSSESLASRPKVTFNGFPFLTQAIRGRYRDVSVSATDVRRGPVVISRLDAHLHGVRLRLVDALRGTVGTEPVDAVEATALLRYADLSAALPNRRLTLADDNGRIRLRGAVTVFGKSLSGSALGQVRVESDRLTILPRHITLDAGGATLALNPALAAALTYSVPINLPFGLKLRSVQPQPDGLLVHTSGDRIVLRS